MLTNRKKRLLYKVDSGEQSMEKRFFDPPFVPSQELTLITALSASNNFRRTLAVLSFSPKQKTAQELLQERIESAFDVICWLSAKVVKNAVITDDVYTERIVCKDGKFESDIAERLQKNFEL